MALILLIVGVLFNLFLAILAAMQRQDRAARSLVYVAVGLIWWEVANYAADLAVAPLLWNRLTFIGPLILLVASYFFVSALRERTVTSLERIILFGGTLAISLLCLTPIVVPSIEERIVDGIVVGFNPTRGIGYAVYLAWAAALILINARRVFSPLGHASSILRAQMQLLRIGTFGAILVPLITNILLPNLSQSSSSTQYVPLMSIIYMGSLSVAILKHKMLDIQDFVLRAGVFSFTTIILGTLYVTPIILLATYIWHLHFEPYQIALIVIIGTITAMAYNRLYQWFVGITNKIFFKEAYEPTELLAELNGAFLNTTDVDKMLSLTTRIIKQRLKAQYCYFMLETGDAKSLDRVFQTESRSVFKGEDSKAFELLNSEMTGDVLMLDALVDRQKFEFLTKGHASIVIRLYSTSEGKKGSLGYMIVGSRKSGKPYNSVDAKVLETAADALSIAVQEALYFEKIEAFNESLRQSVDEATSKLRASNSKLQRLDESKDEFISMASHQLRTPLTSIKGYISMVLDGDMGEINPQQRKVLEEAFASSQRMVYLIGDFLNVSRIQTGKFMLEKSQVQLAHIIKDEIEQLKATAAARHITLAYTAPENFPVLELDENKIRQVMMNFIDNAIYYSPMETTITVSIVKHPRDITFKVEDQGIGVPKSEQHQLFTKFYRASNARKQRPDGTGIGLFMAKKVIVAHGGSIIFETREGKGSTFGFRLPVTAATLQSESARTEAIAQQV